jgi:hypothetical protein
MTTIKMAYDPATSQNLTSNILYSQYLNLLQPKQTPISLSNTFYTQQNNHCMRRTPGVIRGKSPKETHGALFL